MVGFKGEQCIYPELGLETVHTVNAINDNHRYFYVKISGIFPRNYLLLYVVRTQLYVHVICRFCIIMSFW